MAEYYIDPEDILSDFLRTNLVDPSDRAEDANSDNFTATSGQKAFVLTPTAGTSVSCVTSVTVNAATKLKWQDFHWDYQTGTLTFFTGLTVGDALIVNYKEGSSNWIFSDQPDDELGADNFPRISLFVVGGGGERRGQYNAPFEGRPIVQIDFWARDGKIKTINGRKYSNNYLSRYLAYQTIKAFEDNESQLFPALYNVIPIGVPRTAPFSEEFQAYHTVLEVNVSGISPGRLED